MPDRQPMIIGKLEGIQYLRFVAAALVVLIHCYEMAPKVGRGDVGLSFPLGAAGVDIFFVISGFIMMTITQARPQTPSEFALNRLTRVAPMYWLLTTVMAILLLIAPKMFDSSSFSMPAVIASFLFYPWRHPSLEGAMPILPLGWTLNYEFLFYVLFAVAMGVKRSWRGLLASVMLLGLVISGLIFHPSGVALRFYTGAIILEFVYGIIIAYIYLNLPAAKPVWGFALCVSGAVALALMYQFPVGRLSASRPVLWGIPAAIIVLGIVELELTHRIPKVKLLRTLGDASYSIYLTHIFTLGVVRLIWSRLHLRHSVSDLALIATGMTLSLLVGYLAYRFVETPLVDAGHRLRGGVTGARQRRLQQDASGAT